MVVFGDNVDGAHWRSVTQLCALRAVGFHHAAIHVAALLSHHSSHIHLGVLACRVGEDVLH